MMLNKQFLALALAAGASFLVGCEDDDAAVDRTECAAYDVTGTFTETPDDTKEADITDAYKCADCVAESIDDATNGAVPSGETATTWRAALIARYDTCGLSWEDQCATSVGDLAAPPAVGSAGITSVRTHISSDADDAKCLKCFNWHMEANGETDALATCAKITTAFTTCGGTVATAAACPAS